MLSTQVLTNERCHRILSVKVVRTRLSFFFQQISVAGLVFTRAARLFFILRAGSRAFGSAYQHSDIILTREAIGSTTEVSGGNSGLCWSEQTTFRISSRLGSTPTRSQYGGCDGGHGVKGVQVLDATSQITSPSA